MQRIIQQHLLGDSSQSLSKFFDIAHYYVHLMFNIQPSSTHSVLKCDLMLSFVLISTKESIQSNLHIIPFLRFC